MYYVYNAKYKCVFCCSCLDPHAYSERHAIMLSDNFQVLNKTHGQPVCVRHQVAVYELAIGSALTLQFYPTKM